MESSSDYDIIFTGLILPGEDVREVKARVGELFKIRAEQLDRLFSGNPIAIKRSVGLETAKKYREAFQKAGALVELRRTAAPQPPPTGPSSSGPPPSAVDAPSAAGTVDPLVSDWDLLPPRTGSLIDCAPAAAEPPDVDLAELSLRPAAGPLVDASPPPPALERDTSDLSLRPPEGPLVDPAPEPPPPTVDLSELSLAGPRSGSLEDCAQPVTPATIPDLSHLSLDDQKPERSSD